MIFARSDDEIIGLFLLQDEPHTLYIVLGISPVAQGIQVTQIQLVLQTVSDTCCGKGDFSGNEGLSAALTLMVEENAIAAEHAIALTIILDNPVTIEFCHSVRTARIEGGRLLLWHFLYLTV